MGRGIVFQLFHDPHHNVLLTRFSGTYVATDISLRDKAVGRFVARNGLARGIMDYTAVEAVDIPIEVVVERSARPPQLPGQARVIVAPREPLWAMNRIFAAHRLFRHGEEPILVRSIEEAYQALSMVDPVFEPVAADLVSRLEGVAHDVLAGIEADLGPGGPDATSVLRAAMQVASTDEGAARILTEQLALSAAAAELRRLGAGRIADAFIETRLAGQWRATYGMLDARHDARLIIDTLYPAM